MYKLKLLLRDKIGSQTPKPWTTWLENHKLDTSWLLKQWLRNVTGWWLTEDSLFFPFVHELSCFIRVWLFAALWTAAHQAPLSVGFSRQKCWSRLPCPPPGDLPNPGIEPRFPALQADSLPAEPQGKPKRLWRSHVPQLRLITANKKKKTTC